MPCATEVIRAPLERVDLGLFGELAAGDIVFVDSSQPLAHGIRRDGVVYRVLPLLEAGVTVGLHDIFLPFDYPRSGSGYYSEQFFWRAISLLGARRSAWRCPCTLRSSTPSARRPVRHARGGAPAGVEPAEGRSGSR